MSALRNHQSMTAEEYLNFERQSNFRHEYVHGQLLQKSSLSRRHVWLTSNLTALIFNQMEKLPYDVMSSQMRVQVEASTFLYPDVLVASEDSIYIGENEDILLTPTVVIEALSPSTQDYDRGRKWQHYRRIAALQDYLLISQDMILVEHYTRTGETSWNFQEYLKLRDIVSLGSIGCELKLEDIYQKIDFSSTDEE